MRRKTQPKLTGLTPQASLILEILNEIFYSLRSGGRVRLASRHRPAMPGCAHVWKENSPTRSGSSVDLLEQLIFSPRKLKPRLMFKAMLLDYSFRCRNIFKPL